jgi:hypothetical protein
MSQFSEINVFCDQNATIVLGINSMFNIGKPFKTVGFVDINDIVAALTQ